VPSSETCDGIDDDCDGIVDNVANPVGGPPLSVARVGTDFLLSWAPIAGATAYDVVRGDLFLLRTSAGDFTAAMDGCVSNDRSGTSVQFFDDVTPGGGSWYLVRGVNCGGGGTYNSDSASQIGNRDPEIAAAPETCP
jgi:hypothetical protein